jgi:hypothetical protein
MYKKIGETVSLEHLEFIKKEKRKKLFIRIIQIGILITFFYLGDCC